MGDRSGAGSRPLCERVVDALPDAIVVADPEGRVLVANVAARALLGVGQAAEGRAIEALLPGVPPLKRSAVRDGQAEFPVVVAGGRRVVKARWMPLAPDGPDGTVILLRDASQTRVADASARRAAVLAGLSRFTHRMAHELKNPIGALKLYTLLLERQFRDAKPDGRTLIEKIVRSIDHLSAQVAGTTDLGLPSSLELEALEPAGLLDDCLTALAERIEGQGLRVVRSYEPGVKAHADARALRPGLLALVENALDAMPSGGTLTLGCAGTADGTARAVEIVVQDTGAGMSDDVQAQLDEPFFTTKADGTGLGMMVAHHVAGQHGGRIEVRSRAGEGTLVRVVLPVS